jgi:hypothetical protein
MANKRVLGARRAQAGGWGALRRFLWACGMSLAPALFLWRLAAALRNRPALWGLFFSSLPVLAAIYLGCALGEALGYLAGAGGSRETFLRTELQVGRDG